MASKLELINSALILIGDLPLESLTGNTKAHTVVNALYDNIVQTELSKFPWGFASKQAQLQRHLDQGNNPINPLFDFSAGYLLPSDLLRLTRLSPNQKYKIYGEPETPETNRNQIVAVNYTDDLYCEYVCNVDENEWPAYFSKMVEYALAMEFAPAIRDSASSMQLMAQQYLNASRMARYTDSQQHPQTPIQDRPFINVRF